MTKFDELAIGDKVVTAREDSLAQGYEKKSLSTAYVLIGGKNGELVRDGVETDPISKKSPVIKLVA
jgi:hypothetical protein